MWLSITGNISQKHPHILNTLLASLDDVENVDIKHLDSRVVYVRALKDFGKLFLDLKRNYCKSTLIG